MGARREVVSAVAERYRLAKQHVVRALRQRETVMPGEVGASREISIISLAKSSARSSQASVYSSRNSLWRAIQRKTVALAGVPASLQMARRLLPSASRAQIDMAT